MNYLDILYIGLAAFGLLNSWLGFKKVVKWIQAVNAREEALEAVRVAYHAGKMSPAMHDRWVDVIDKEYKASRRPSPLNRLLSAFKKH